MFMLSIYSSPPTYAHPSESNYPTSVIVEMPLDVQYEVSPHSENQSYIDPAFQTEPHTLNCFLNFGNLSLISRFNTFSGFVSASNLNRTSSF